MNYITPKELKQKMDEGIEVTILDVREPYEHSICNIGGLHIPMATIAARIDEIPTRNEVVVLCRTGKRAEAVANMLVVDFQINNVSIVEGGMVAWIEQVDNTLELY